MSHDTHPEMLTILREQAARPTPDLQALPLSVARDIFATNAVPWNVPLPPMEWRAVVVGETACMLLLPEDRLPGLVLFVHGGGWTFGRPGTHQRFARLLAGGTRRAVLVPDYRLAPEHPCPAAIDDVADVLHALPSLPEAAGPLVLCGDSAGANIALAAALDGAAPRAAMLSLLYGCFAPVFDTGSHQRNGDGRWGLSTARMRWYWANWLGAAHDPRAAPLHAALDGLPPVHLLAAGLDPLLDDSVLLAGRLAAAGVPVRLDVVPGVVHGFLQMTARLRSAMQATGIIAAAICQAMDEQEPGETPC